MKTLLKKVGSGMLLWLWFSLVTWVSYVCLKAWSSTNSTSDWSPSDIYAWVWETLSAIKRNTLASKASAPALSQQYSSSAILSTTSTTWVDTDMTITMNTPAWHVFLFMNGSSRNTTVGKANAFIFNIDGSDVVSNGYGNTHENTDVAWYWKSVSASWLASVSAWSHTFKVRRKTQWSTARMSDWSHNRQFQVLVLP